jgi:TP901 family phage tail tape measure protein
MAKDYTVNVTVNGKDEASGIFESVGKSATKWLAAAAIAAASAAAGFQGLMVSADFEQQMSSVQAVAMATASEMGRMRDAAVEWGASTAFSASQVAMGMEELAKAGLKPNEVLGSIGAMLDLAAAGGLELADSARIAAAAMNTFKLPASEVSHVADVLAVAASTTATDVLNLGYALQYAGPGASALKIPLEDTVAALAMMSKNGIDASMAGTSFRNILTSLVNPTDAAKKSLHDLSISVIDGNKQFLPFKDILKQFPPSLLDTAEGMRHINTIFGERGAPGLIALIQQGAEAFVQMKTDLEFADGAAREMAEIRMDNFRGSVEELKGAAESLAITLFGSGDNDKTSVKGGLRTFMDEVLTPLIKTTKDVTQVWNPLNDVAQRFGVEIMSLLDFGKSFVSSLVEAGQGFSWFVSEITGAIADIAKGVWVPLTTAFFGVMDEIGNAFIGVINFIGEKAAALGNAVFSPVRAALDKMGVDVGEFNWDPITTTPARTASYQWSLTADEATARMVSAKEHMQTAFSELGESGATIFNTMKNSWDGNLTQMEEKAKTTDAGIMDELAEMAEWYAMQWNKVPPKVQDVVDKTARVINVGGLAIPKEFGLHIDAIKSQIGTLPSSLDIALLAAKKVVDEADIGGGFYRNTQKGWGWYINELPTWEKSTYDGMKRIANAIDGVLSDGFADFIRHGKVDFEAGMKAIGDAGARAIGDALSAAVMKNLVDPGIKAVQGAFGEAFSGISSGLGSVIGGVTGSLISAGLMQAGAAIINEVVGAFTPDYEARRKDRERSNALTREYYTVEGIGAELTGSEWKFGREELFRIAARMDEIIKVRGSLSAATTKEQMEYMSLVEDLGDMEQAVSAGVGLQELQDAMKNNPSFLQSMYGGNINFSELEEMGRGSSRYRDIMPIALLQSLPRELFAGINFHGGGAIPGEGLFLGLEGEGVLTRRAMGNLGIEGLQRLNQGGGTGETYIFVIQAMDGEDVERVIDRRIIPMLREKSEAGVTVIHERGIKSA